MSRYSGRFEAGASKLRRERARFDAVMRNAATPLERTAKFRRDRARVQAALAEARTNPEGAS